MFRTTVLHCDKLSFQPVMLYIYRPRLGLRLTAKIISLGIEAQFLGLAARGLGLDLVTQVLGLDLAVLGLGLQPYGLVTGKVFNYHHLLTYGPRTEQARQNTAKIRLTSVSSKINM